VKLTAALVAIGFVAFAAGWWLGRSSALDVRAGERFARLEADVERIRSDLRALGGAGSPSGQPGPDPAKVYEIAIGSSPTLGAPDAAVTIIQIADFECPFCSSAVPTMKRLLEVYSGQVRLVFKHNPLPIHPRALQAHKASMAAAAQGKFWEMHDRLFASQEKLELEDLKSHAKELGLDLAAFERDMSSPATAEAIKADQILAGRFGSIGVPSFFINGRFIPGAQPYDLFRDRIEEELRAQ